MGKSLGLKTNVFMLNMITVGITAEEQAAAATTGIKVVNDIPGARARAKPAVHEEGIPTTVDSFLRRFFGHNADRVRRNFEAADGYGAYFTAVTDEWSEETPTQAYADSRALRIYNATTALSKGMFSASGGRCKSRYIPMGYIAAWQTSKHRNLWPFSTRATEGRGARIKRNDRRKVSYRPRTTTGDVMRAIKNLKTGGHSYRSTIYMNSSASEQLMRIGSQQEEIWHEKRRHASRLAATGRRTLKRTMPKFMEAELPSVDKPMLDITELNRMALLLVDIMGSGVDWGSSNMCPPCVS
jgi:hypothetical protein